MPGTRNNRNESFAVMADSAGANPLYRGIGAATADKAFEFIDQNGNVTGSLTIGGALTIAGALTMAGTAVGGKANVISGQGATRTLLASESGSTCYFDRAAGIIYTLPAPAVGLYYDFVTTVTVTTNNYTVITDTGTTFVLGFVAMGISGAATSLYATGNGTSHIKLQSNGGTTGGIIGSQYRFTCVSTTVWQVTGLISGTATLATPFA